MKKLWENTKARKEVYRKMEVTNESYNNSNQAANNRADNPLKISNEDIK